MYFLVCLLKKVYPDADHYLELDPILYNDTFNYQRRFFRECLIEPISKTAKPILQEEHD